MKKTTFEKYAMLCEALHEAVRATLNGKDTYEDKDKACKVVEKHLKTLASEDMVELVFKPTMTPKHFKEAVSDRLLGIFNSDEQIKSFFANIMEWHSIQLRKERNKEILC